MGAEVSKTMKHLLSIAIPMLAAGCSPPTATDDPACRAAFRFPGVLIENSTHGNIESITITLADTDPIMVNDQLLEHLQGLPELRRLRINNIYGREYPVTDRGMENLVRVTTIEQLRLQYASVSDRGVQALLNLSNLQLLDLTGTAITDQSVKLIAQHWPSLQQLSLNSTDITVDCVPFLVSMQNLETLDLLQTRLTNSQARSIKERMPTCSIIHSSRSRIKTEP